MPVKDYIPQFPYRGAQLIHTSGRVVIHAKKDAVFLFGKQAIGLSSPGRVNIDSGTGTTINSPEIELGLSAKEEGEPIAKAQTLVNILTSLLEDLQQASHALSNISESGFAESLPLIVNTATKLTNTCGRVRSDLDSIKSKITFTK